jgi:hypothetical protein
MSSPPRLPNPNIMKTRPLQKIMCRLSLLFAALAVASCGTGSSGKPGSVALQPAHWSKVKNNPPTYYPKGVSADHPTTVSDGMWVMTGDSAGTRYFIPARGVDTQGLTDEALAARTPEERKRIEKAGAREINPAGMFGAAATGIGYTLLEVDRHASRSPYSHERAKGQAGILEYAPRR